MCSIICRNQPESSKPFILGVSIILRLTFKVGVYEDHCREDSKKTLRSFKAGELLLVKYQHVADVAVEFTAVQRALRGFRRFERHYNQSISKKCLKKNRSPEKVKICYFYGTEHSQFLSYRTDMGIKRSGILLYTKLLFFFEF